MDFSLLGSPNTLISYPESSASILFPCMKALQVSLPAPLLSPSFSRLHHLTLFLPCSYLTRLISPCTWWLTGLRFQSFLVQEDYLPLPPKAAYSWAGSSHLNCLFTCRPALLRNNLGLRDRSLCLPVIVPLKKNPPNPLKSCSHCFNLLLKMCVNLSDLTSSHRMQLYLCLVHWRALYHISIPCVGTSDQITL